MLNIYIYKKLDNISHIPVLNYYLGRQNIGINRYGDKVVELLNKPFFNLVDNPKNADYFLIPHNFFSIKDSSYVDSFISLSKEHNKKIIIFAGGDSDKTVDIPGSIIFRNSQYSYKKKPNEIIMPALVDDLTDWEPITYRQKSVKPVVGFCGWASYGNFERRMIETIKLISIYLKIAFVNKNFYFHKKGLLFRIQTIKILKKSRLIDTIFIIRDSFSGNEKTRKVDGEIARREYINNIINSDLSLSVKGDGNYSNRFYEIISLGRIPLFVNTDCVMPIEDVVDYRSFVLKVDCRDIKNIDKIVLDFYSNISEEDFVSMQRKAREVFEKYLRADKFFSFVFNQDFLKKYE